MSTTTTARRIALFGTSSLGLAAIVSAASLGAALAPTAAHAQMATCTVGVTPLAGPAVVIPSGTYNPNITCVYVGDGATVSTGCGIDVSTAAPGGGINLNATGTDDINWNSTAGTVIGDDQTNGPVIDALTDDGDIAIDTEGVWSFSTSATHAIRARSLGGGSIDITANLGSGAAVFMDASVGQVGMEAVTAGGDILITAHDQILVSAGTLASPINSTGIIAQTSGAGRVELDLRNRVVGSGPDGSAVRVSAGSGGVLINNIGGEAELRGGQSGGASSVNMASAIVVETPGDVVVNSNGLIMGAVNPTGSRAAAIVADAATFTLTMTGNASTAADNFMNYRASLGGSHGGTGIVADQSATNVAAYTGGHVDLSGVSGGVEMNFNTRSRWVVTDTSLLSPVDDVVNIDAQSILMTVGSGVSTSSFALLASVLRDDVDQSQLVPGIIDFSGGADTLNNLGRIIIGQVMVSTSAVGNERHTPPNEDLRLGVRGELGLLNLDEFNNSGDIWLGAKLWGNDDLATTDFWTDDMIYMPGAAFHGGDGSRIMMDVNLAASQSSCAPETRDENGWLAADCIGIQGGSATGRTELVIHELVPGDRGGYAPDGIVLIDLAGGNVEDTDPEAFFISPTVARYTDAIGNGSIDKGLFFYTLGFDAETQQFKLFGQPSSAGQQFPMLATAANQLWHTATGGWFQRQVDQRYVDRDEGLGTGAWFNATGTNSTRDITTSIPVGISSVDFDNSYDQNDVALTFGWDLISHDANAGSWALGAMVGYAQSQIEFEGDNAANLEGVHAGVYGGYAWGGFFVDAAVNSAWLSLHDEAPALNLTPAGTMLGTDVHSLGARIEAGWRWRSGPMWVEPIVGLSTVTTEFDEIRIPNDDPDPSRPGGVVTLDASDSRRGSFGVGIGVDDLMADVAPTSLSLTARRVNEFEGQSDVIIANTGPDALITDTFDGEFTQLTGSIGVSNVARTISGYLNLDAVQGDDYESLGVSIGARLQW